ncbi:dehydrogenase [Streptomyces sp. NPDC051219]|uniref:dehydrogenase n=1 Tax=Streptomyces sp. NPDC051219 TaxID=3155283 RepID=UPI00342C8D8F
MSSESPPACPECDQPMKSGGFVLCGREDDGKRICRMLWRCPKRHLWWKWADRPEDPLELCPYPQIFQG